MRISSVGVEFCRDFRGGGRLELRFGEWIEPDLLAELNRISSDLSGILPTFRVLISRSVLNFRRGFRGGGGLELWFGEWIEPELLAEWDRISLDFTGVWVGKRVRVRTRKHDWLAVSSSDLSRIDGGMSDLKVRSRGKFHRQWWGLFRILVAIKRRR